MPFSYTPDARRAYINIRRYRDKLALMRHFHQAGFCPRCGETPEEILRKAELALQGEEIRFQIARLVSKPTIPAREIETLIARLVKHSEGQEQFITELKARLERMREESRYEPETT